ncbi:hypothetical protein GCM10009595_13340 [Falsarthrobacter nasiphocae]
MLDATCLNEARVDAVSELCDDHKGILDLSTGIGLIGVELDKVDHTLPVHPLDPHGAPEPMIALYSGPPRR